MDETFTGGGAGWVAGDTPSSSWIYNLAGTAATCVREEVAPVKPTELQSGLGLAASQPCDLELVPSSLWTLVILFVK